MILTYHELSELDLPYAYHVSCRRFEEHLRLLTEQSGGLPPDGASPITFDDGHASHFRHAMPLLEAHGARHAIFFVVGGWIDRRPGYMTWSQAKEIAARGYEVQSHSWSHPFLARCDAAQLRREMETSKAVLEDRLGRPVDAISAPGGSWNWQVISACAAAGYKRVYISDPWFGARERDGVQVTGRLMVRGSMTAARLRRLFEAETKPWSVLRLPHRLRQTMRRAVGETLYHELWRLAARERTRQEISC